MRIATSMAAKKVADNISSLKKILEVERAVKILNTVDTKTIEGKLRKPKKDQWHFRRPRMQNKKEGQ